MKRERVTSTTVTSLGYDPRSRTLEVEFVSGNVYRYADVEAYVHRAFLRAASKGGFFNDHVRDVYAFERVD